MESPSAGDSPHHALKHWTTAAITCPATGGCGVCGSADDRIPRARRPFVASELRIGKTRCIARSLARAPAERCDRRHPCGQVRRCERQSFWCARTWARHNALDKLIGAMAWPASTREAVSPSSPAAPATNWRSRPRRPASRLSPRFPRRPRLAIALAASAKLYLVGFARDGHCGVYAHAGRLVR